MFTARAHSPLTRLQEDVCEQRVCANTTRSTECNDLGTSRTDSISIGGTHESRKIQSLDKSNYIITLEEWERLLLEIGGGFSAALSGATYE